jgi:hypothetical protein
MGIKKRNCEPLHRPNSNAMPASNTHTLLKPSNIMRLS